MIQIQHHLSHVRSHAMVRKIDEPDDLLLSLFLLVPPDTSAPRHKCLLLVVFVIGWIRFCPSLLLCRGDPKWVTSLVWIEWVDSVPLSHSGLWFQGSSCRRLRPAYLPWYISHILSSSSIPNHWFIRLRSSRLLKEKSALSVWHSLGQCTLRSYQSL